jgi:uncharacterized protein involved in type VI secretion and phage assembly
MSAPSGMGWYVFDVNTSQQCDFQVISINGFESLGQPYSFDIELVSESYDLVLSQIIGCPATLTIQPPWGSTASFYHGIITNIQSLKVTNQGMMHYRVLMEPRYSRLKQTKLNYIYTNTVKGYGLSDLIAEVLNRQALTSGTDYQIGSIAPILRFSTKSRVASLLNQSGFALEFRVEVLHGEFVRSVRLIMIS